MKRILIAANTRSARGRGEEILREAQTGLSRTGVHCEVLVSQHHGHLFEGLPVLLREKWDAIAALGGDGTLFQVVNACLRQPDFNTPVALIPAGTGNSFAQEFRDGRLRPDWERILTGTHTAIDVLHCRLREPVEAYHSEYYFLNVVGAGFVSEVNITSQRYKHLGMFAYALGVFLTLVKLRPAQLRMVLDERMIERDSVFVMICNSRYIGGNMKVAPEARLDDGLMDIVLAKEISRIGLIRAFPSVFAGHHTDHPKIEMFRGRKLRLESDPPQLLTPDGEIVGKTPMEIEVLPRRLQFIL
ncbi:MAG: diacylglycerol/lipid kinase family protein [bacterium]